MDPWRDIENFSQITGKPVIIGEFHFGALDRGMDATGLRGVESQYERGVAYRRYMYRAASHPMCLGAHYFILYDQAYLGRFDGENYQIGALDVCSHPYSEFIDGIVKKYHPDWLAEKTASGTAAGGGVVQTESQSNDPQRTPPRKSGKTKTGGSSLRTAPERKPAEAPAEPIITEQEETKNEPS